MGATSSAKNLVKALELLRVLSERAGSLGLSEVSRLGGVPKPTAHRLLAALAEAGMVRENGSGEYGLGPQCLVLGGAFLEGLSLREEAREVLEALVERTGETGHLGIRDGDRVVYVEKIESPQVVRLRSRVGLIAPLHSTALGKVLLAYEGDEEVGELFSGGVERRTANTITDVEAFRDELAAVRERGYAVDDGENEASICCVAAPVLDHTGGIVASVSVSGPEYRVSNGELEKFGRLTREAAGELSRRIGHRPNGIGEEETLRERDLVPKLE